MPQAPQTALERYKARRNGEIPGPLATAPPRPARGRARGGVPGRRVRLALLGLFCLAFALTLRLLVAPPPAALELRYEIDLSEAPQGTLIITLAAEGRLPRNLELAFPPGVFGDAANGVTPHTPTANEVGEDGRPGRSLALERTADGWRLGTGGVRRADLVYRVDLRRSSGSDEDIRRHISTPVAGGVRVAGYEVFLEPVGHPVEDITVTIRNPGDLPVVVPWPALVQRRTAAVATPDSLAAAHLGAGQGFRPAGDLLQPVGRTAPGSVRDAAAAGTRSFHPRSLDELTNALLVCGDLRTATTRTRDCVIQYATDRRWNFEDAAALDLIRRIARTELGFFGSSPSPSITVLLAANEVTAAEGFDAYGVHTGSSVLVMIDPASTWGEVEEQTASIIAHEMFHGWLGEAIPQDDPATLWFTEGATSWYAVRMLTAAGIWTPAHARTLLAARLERDYHENPLLNEMSVAAAAAEVMAGADQVRFGYAGGMAACMALDDWLSENSGIERPLDGVLRRLYEQRDGRPLSVDGLVDAVHQVTGVDCAAWLQENVYDKTALPPSDRLI